MDKQNLFNVYYQIIEWKDMIRGIIVYSVRPLVQIFGPGNFQIQSVGSYLGEG